MANLIGEDRRVRTLVSRNKMFTGKERQIFMVDK
jgi:hypothetical protein